MMLGQLGWWSQGSYCSLVGKLSRAAPQAESSCIKINQLHCGERLLRGSRTAEDCSPGITDFWRLLTDAGIRDELKKYYKKDRTVRTVYDGNRKRLGKWNRKRLGKWMTCRLLSETKILTVTDRQTEWQLIVSGANVSTFHWQKFAYIYIRKKKSFCVYAYCVYANTVPYYLLTTRSESPCWTQYRLFFTVCTYG